MIEPGRFWFSKGAILSLALHAAIGAAVGVSNAAAQVQSRETYEIELWTGLPRDDVAEPRGASLAPARDRLEASARAEKRHPAARRAPARSEPDRDREPAAAAETAPATAARADRSNDDGAVSSAPPPRSSAAPPAPLSEREVDQPPRLLGRVAPRYPRSALERGIEADVVLSLIVDASGRVRDARVLVSAARGFDTAALEAARTLRFAPGIERGRPVAVRVTWTCRFRLEG